MNKSEIRKKILELRKRNYSKSIKIDSKSIINFIRKKKFNKKIIGAYYAYNYEVNIIHVLKKFEKLNYKISLPKIGKNFQMNFYPWSSKDPLIINKYGIPEPISKEIKYPDILLVPMVAFDKNFNRVGYGGGFYDRYIKKLKKIKKIITIGIAYSFQKVKKIPIGKNDIKLDFIVTEREA